MRSVRNKTTDNRRRTTDFLISQFLNSPLGVRGSNMAIVKGPFQVTGSVGELSFYTRRGSDKVIMRTKGGASGDKIKRLPQYAGFRNQQKEWSGVTKCASGVRMAFCGLHRIADYNLTAPLNGLVNKMQKADSTAEKGKRPVRLSDYKQALDGFNFNRNQPFNSVCRVSVSFEIDRAELTATVNIPRINTAIDLVNLQRLPYFRLLVAIGTASDMIYNEVLNDYLPAVEGLHGASAIVISAWFAANAIIEEHQLVVSMTDKQKSRLTDSVSVILSIAVEFGTIGITGEPVEVKYAGSGKVLKVS